MPQGLLRTVQGDAIVIAQAIVLKHAFKFHQLGDYRIAVHGMKLDDGDRRLALSAPLRGQRRNPLCPGHAKCRHGDALLIAKKGNAGWVSAFLFRRRPSKARQSGLIMRYRGVEYTLVQGIEREIWKWSAFMEGGPLQTAARCPEPTYIQRLDIS